MNLEKNDLSTEVIGRNHQKVFSNKKAQQNLKPNCLFVSINDNRELANVRYVQEIESAQGRNYKHQI